MCVLLAPPAHFTVPCQCALSSLLLCTVPLFSCLSALFTMRKTLTHAFISDFILISVFGPLNGYYAEGRSRLLH
ncbi:uncharacterized protein EDB93DRAFT_1157172 [Suillus bovinus]|uniref:uncharacterized protein n=1 Tax=Suillus bovinus TaxID=48563 RepID=UPI001B86CED4|nr:uncharacterized protein EDB93DRAFT_1157172 [Suillus bovinus]KAG2142913.1 hypothetical protein EDB93DRAFT_1157172 [Suillus bovinus]